MFKKWMITLLLAFATLAVSFASSAYSGGVAQIIGTFDCSEEVAVLGIALFVVGVWFNPAPERTTGADKYPVRNRAPSLGAAFGNVRPAAAILHHIWSHDRLQCWSSRVPEYRDSRHPPLLRRCLWLESPHQCR